MRFLEFIHKVDEDVLLEAARDRYMQMFQNIPSEVYDAANIEKSGTHNSVQSAMDLFKRSDRITWALRLQRHRILLNAREQAVQTLQGNIQISDEARLQAEQVIEYVNIQEARLVKKSGMNDYNLKYAAEAFAGSIVQMTHFISLPIDAIQNYEFGWQQPAEIIQYFRGIEREWQEARRREVSHSEDYKEDEIEPIIQFPDGSAWFDLNRSSCGTEGNAMGHCGNTAGTKESHTVLSYRTPTKDGKWIPRMTFILDKEHDTLGEMKGYANEKPAEKYHPYIVELLKQPYIKGFGPGGYQPENNFNINDLPEEQAEALKEMKPGFRSPLEQYKEEGMTEALVARISNMVNEVTSEEIKYVPEDKEFIVDSYKNLNQAAEYLGGDHAAWIVKVMDGTEYLGDGGYEGIDTYQMADLLDLMPPEILQKISLHIINEYDEEYDEEYDFSNTRDMATILEEQGDNLDNIIKSAISDGNNRGAENEMYEAFEEWIKDLSENYSARIAHKWDEGDATLRIGEESLAEIASSGDSEALYEIEQGGWKEALNIKDIDTPYYGWQGYDETEAKERFIDEFDEEQLNLEPLKVEA